MRVGERASERTDERQVRAGQRSDDERAAHNHVILKKERVMMLRELEDAAARACAGAR